jgi:hypothetical protein
MKQGQTVKAMVEVKIVNVLVLRDLRETVFLLKRGGDIVLRVLPLKTHTVMLSIHIPSKTRMFFWTGWL